jgi:hypothetical protein
MNISLQRKCGADDMIRDSHYSSNHGSAVWRVSLAVLVVTNSLLLFFLYIYDVI